MTYTEGPWEYQPHTCRIISLSAQEGGEPITVISTFGAMGGDDCQADARLMAAAPDMLAALRECVTDENAYAMRNDPLAVHRRLRAINAVVQAVIAKAEGRS